MGKVRVGNKQNSFLNQMWAKHGRVDGKKRADRARRQEDKRRIIEALKDLQESQMDIDPEIQEVVNKNYFDLL